MPLGNRVFSPVSPLCKTRSFLLSPLTGPVLQTYHERSWHNSVPTAFNSASLQTAEKRAPSLRPTVPQTAPSSSARIKAMLHLTFPGSRSNSPGAACTLRAHRTEWQHKGSHGPWWLSSPARDSRSLRWGRCDKSACRLPAGNGSKVRAGDHDKRNPNNRRVGKRWPYSLTFPNPPSPHNLSKLVSAVYTHNPDSRKRQLKPLL